MDTVTDITANVVRQSDGTLALRQYKIGDIAQGGIIFYIDESGEHGLAADTVDLSTGIRWYAGSYGSTRRRRRWSICRRKEHSNYHILTSGDW